MPEVDTVERSWATSLIELLPSEFDADVESSESDKASNSFVVAFFVRDWFTLRLL